MTGGGGSDAAEISLGGLEPLGQTSNSIAGRTSAPPISLFPPLPDLQKAPFRSSAFGLSIPLRLRMVKSFSIAGNASASVDEKKQIHDAQQDAVSTSTPPNVNDSPNSNEKSSPTDEKRPKRNAPKLPSFIKTRSFDADLEAGTNGPKSPHLHPPNSATYHPNASSPANIGGAQSPGINDDENDDAGEMGLPLPVTFNEQGRPSRRRNRPARAQSLPTHPPVTQPPPVQGLQPSMVKTLNKLLEPEHKLAPPPTLKTSLYNIATYSWLNVMLIFVPIAWGVVSSSWTSLKPLARLSHDIVFSQHFGHLSDTIIFVFSFLAVGHRDLGTLSGTF